MNHLSTLLNTSRILAASQNGGINDIAFARRESPHHIALKNPGVMAAS